MDSFSINIQIEEIGEDYSELIIAALEDTLNSNNIGG